VASEAKQLKACKYVFYRLLVVFHIAICGLKGAAIEPLIPI